jgi:hypothetical protein
MEEMRQTGLITDVDSDYQVGMPEVEGDPVTATRPPTSASP